MTNKVKYHEILKSYDRYEAAYSYLEDTFGHHTPYMFPDLTGYLVLCVERGTGEDSFKRDARRMYNL